MFVVSCVCLKHQVVTIDISAHVALDPSQKYRYCSTKIDFEPGPVRHADPLNQTLSRIRLYFEVTFYDKFSLSKQLLLLRVNVLCALVFEFDFVYVCFGGDISN